MVSYLPVNTLGPHTFAERNPHAHQLRDKRVTVLGVGAIGHDIALHLDRTGIGRLDLVDSDTCHLATATRQYAPTTTAGAPKAAALAAFARTLRPDLDIRAHDHYIGHSYSPAAAGRSQKLLGMLRGSDLVIDATGSATVARDTATVARHHHVPWVNASATPGLWGGTVFTQTPDGACWGCLQHHRNNHTVPTPAYDPDGIITPLGCAEPTCVGASPDIAVIASQTARTALDVLTCGDRLHSELAVVNLWHDGRPISVPAWTCEPVRHHPSCCGSY